MEIKQIPYSKNHEVKHKKRFWKEQYQYVRKNRGVYPLFERDTSDRWDFVNKMMGLPNLQKLTPRQTKIVYLVMEGHRQKEITIKIGVSRTTIWREMKHIKKNCS